MASYSAGITAYFDDDLPAARAAFEHTAELRADPDLLYVESPGWLGRLAHAEGDLSEAERWARDALIRNDESGGAETAVVTPAYLALAEVAWERDHLDDADMMVVKAQRSIRPLLWQAILVQTVASRVLASRGLLDDARRQLVECGQTYLRGDGSRSLRAVLSERAVDLALMAGDVDDARCWERSHAVDVDRPLPISLQLRLAASVRVVDVRSMVDEAVHARQTIPRRIDTLLAGAALVGRVGETGRCIELVSVATHLAEPNGLTRRFLDAGAEVHDALRSIAATPSAVGAAPLASRFFLESLTAALSTPTGGAPRSTPPNDTLIEPLTRRELQVLDLLTAGQSYADIGAQLYVSRNTVKSHASHIYTKLGVSGRSAATDTARRLSLI
jgi:LuxR family maltose regulon positive regulatory protein